MNSLILTHFRLFSCFCGKQAIGFEKNCTATHTKAMVPAITEAFFDMNISI
ncbi:MAG: hypothetical protein LBH92_00360 [Bacteroidales bacterium]|nr:hypothetical protein [Bacteroidales bacterium]